MFSIADLHPGFGSGSCAGSGSYIGSDSYTNVRTGYEFGALTSAESPNHTGSAERTRNCDRQAQHSGKLKNVRDHRAV